MTPRAAPWLPQPESWGALTVEAQAGAEDSMLELYRRALRIRRTQPALGDGTLSWLGMPDGALGFAREPGFVCVVNVSAEPIAAPDAATLLLASGPLTDEGRVPADVAAWFER